MKVSATFWGALAAIVVVIGGFAVLIVFADGQSSQDKSVDELVASCTTDMATQFHIHPHLSIVINGVVQTVPANIGIDSGCMHPLHTHDIDGIIHVESPVKRDFTLGHFFSLWGQTFNRQQILDAVADDAHAIVMTVNGQVSDDYENLILQDEDQIVITFAATATP